MLAKRLIKSNDSGGGACTNTVDLYNPFPDGGGVALYQLNGNATDVSGNYDGTASNVTYGAGQFGQAGVFNGSSSKVTLDYSAFKQRTMTISVWVKTTSSSFSTIAANFNAASTESGFGIFVLSNGNLLFSVSGGVSGQGFNSEINQVINDNQWHNIVLSFDFTLGGNNLTGYLDGVNVLSTNYSLWSSGTASTALTIGNIASDLYPLTGSIDQVRIFSRALRPYEVEALYTEEYCTPTIVPSEHFNTITYEGNGVARSFTGVGFQPDLVWFKNREDGFFWHTLWDSVRGATKSLFSNNDVAEDTNSTRGYLSSFDPDGMSIVPGSNDISNMNIDGVGAVAWSWKAGGAAVTNTDGTITSQVSANTEAGFSVVKGTAISNGAFTVGHGLSSVPKLYIIKRTNGVGGWITYVESLGASKYLQLNDTAAAGTSTLFWNNTAPTSTVFSMNAGQSIAGGAEFVAYVFAQKEGFSNFGSYVGTGASGNTVVTGFEPAFVMIKNADDTGDWAMFDNKRNPMNPVNNRLMANLSSQESQNSTTRVLNFLTNGFSINSTNQDINAINDNYIYMAFAADPTTIEPTLEDSFNTVTYTGNGGTQTIGGVFEGGGSFNGSSSKIEFPTTSSTPIDFSSENFSFSFWFKADSFNPYGGLLSKWSATDSERAFRLGFPFEAPNNKIRYIERTQSSTNQEFNSSKSLNTGQWYHLAITRTSDLVNIYINGEAETFTASETIRAGGSNSIISGFLPDTSAYFDGSIDQVRLFNTALTDAQVTELYEETDADSHTLNFPSGAGAVALYELNGNANDTGGTYNGTASNVTWLNNGVGFQPDLVWVKGYAPFGDNHFLNDSVRGAGYTLYSNLTSQETLPSADAAISSFDSNGFTLSSSAGVNRSGSNYVAWNWKGAELPAINSNGSIPSVVSANPAAGFSIVSYTGNNIAGATIGHGLGSEPDMIIVKNRDTTDIWTVQHSGLGYTNYIDLSSKNAATVNSSVWYAQPTTEVFSFGANPRGNGSGNKHIAYCFAEVAGFSKFGIYDGGTITSSNIVNLGFRPAFVMLKPTQTVNDWIIYDNKRDTTDPLQHILYPATSGAEQVSTNDDYNLYTTPTGFYFNNTNGFINSSASDVIYMAFANQF